MDNVVDRMPIEFRSLFVDVLAEQDPELLEAMRNQEKPTIEQRNLVNDIFATEIVRELGDDYAPTEKGQRAKRTIEEFWYLWPREVS